MNMPEDCTVDLRDETLFGSELAEDEPDEILSSYFLERSELESFTDPSKRLLVVRAYKGEGKSALIKRTQSIVRSQNDDAIVVSLGITTFAGPGQEATFDEWTNYWRLEIVKAIASEVGTRIKFAGTGDTMQLVELARSDGHRPSGFLKSITDRVRVAYEGVELKAGSPADPNYEEILGRISELPAIWVFVDEVDLNFVDTSAFVNKIAGLLTAARFLMRAIPEVVLRLAIRPNIWTILAAKVENMTHLRQYMIDLTWDAQDLRNLLAKRIASYFERTGQPECVASDHSRRVREEQQISVVFGPDWEWGRKPDGSPDLRPPHVVMATLSRMRPRWLIELCKEASGIANQRESNMILKAHVEAAEEEFGRRRLNDTIVEFRSQCAQLEGVLHGFAEQPARYKTDELLKLLRNRVLNQMNVKIVGQVGSASATSLAQFLFYIGVLTAREDNDDGTYRHFSFAQKPQLLKSSNNLDEGHSWEIHPVFRHSLRLRNSTRATGARRIGREDH